jgi:outer membrane immunogenic protein
MKKLLILTAAAIAVGAAAPAVAADLPARTYTKAPAMLPSPIYDWSGFYIGLNGGGGFSHNCWDLVGAGAEGCHDASGGTFGGQIGYRWQVTNWVFGLEAQGNWADFKGSNLSQDLNNLGNENRTKIDAFGLFTGQIGYAWNNALFYVKGGAAVTDVKYDVFFPAGGPLIDSASETRWGAALGAGFEYGFAPNWSLGFEYDHLFMGSKDVTFASTVVDHIRQDVDIFTVRINYKFGGLGGPVVARY